LGFLQEMKMKIDPKKKPNKWRSNKKNCYCGQKVATYRSFQFCY
jgi:hypothetical protein